MATLLFFPIVLKLVWAYFDSQNLWRNKIPFSVVLIDLGISKKDNSQFVSCLHVRFSWLKDRSLKNEEEGWVAGINRHVQVAACPSEHTVEKQNTLIKAVPVKKYAHTLCQSCHVLFPKLNGFLSHSCCALRWVFALLVCLWSYAYSTFWLLCLLLCYTHETNWLAIVLK